MVHFVAYQMFPEAPLPDTTLSLCYTASVAPFIRWQPARKSAFDQHPRVEKSLSFSGNLQIA